MDTWIVVFIVGAVIASVIGPIIWVAFALFLAAKGHEIATASSGIGNQVAATGLNMSELDALLTRVDDMVRAAYNGSGSSLGVRTNGAAVSPQQQLQIQNMMMQAQNQMMQLDNLSRQRYETRVADISGMAASAGIDWSPGQY